MADNDDKDKRWWQTRRWKLRLMLLGLFVCGAGLIAASLFVTITWLAEVVRELGGACIVSAGLGITVESWLRAGLAKDAFEGAMGYVLPPTLRDAVRWIGGREWLCEKHVHHVIIKEIGENLVEVTTQISRTLKNITDRDLKITAYLHMDDWGDDKQSRIIDCEVLDLNGKVLETAVSEQLADTTVRARTKEVTVRARESVIIKTSGVEYKPRNSDLHIAFEQASISPEMNLTYDDDKFFATAYCTGHGENVPDTYLKRQTFTGTLLPGQRMVVRWHPKR